MNNEQRKRVTSIIDELSSLRDTLSNAVSLIEEIRDEEQDKYDNMPEGLQQGSKGDDFMDKIQYLESACENIDSAISDLESL